MKRRRISLAKAHPFWGLAKDGKLATVWERGIPRLYDSRAVAKAATVYLEGYMQAPKPVRVYLVVEDD